MSRKLLALCTKLCQDAIIFEAVVVSGWFVLRWYSVGLRLCLINVLIKDRGLIYQQAFLLPCKFLAFNVP